MLEHETYCPICREVFDRYHAHLLIYNQTVEENGGGDSLLTTDRDDPRLGHGLDIVPQDQNEVYLVLPPEQRSLEGRIRPVRTTYVHSVCGTNTQINTVIAETYAADPHFYGTTYCYHCRQHLPVTEFFWLGTTEKVGS